MTQQNTDQSFEPQIPWEQINPVSRCAVLSQVSEWINYPNSFPRNKLSEFLDCFEVNNGRQARLWLEYKYEESAMKMIRNDIKIDV